MNHFLSITDFTKQETISLINQAIELKKKLYLKEPDKPVLNNQTMVMIFEKPSLRTRLSFEIGMTQLGGHAIYLAPTDIGLGSRESISDISKVTSSMADIIMARTFSHKTLEKLAKYSSVPVINALSDFEHPCQILADLMTIQEAKGKIEGLTLSFIGDCNNNVTNSLALAAATLGMNFKCASPAKYRMKDKISDKVKNLATKAQVNFEQYTDPAKAVKDADIVVTDTWVSMGLESEKQERIKTFKQYQVDKKLMAMAKADAIFLHCLPAYRENEVSADVIDGKQSYVFQEAENRLHAQKALILYLLNKGND